MLPSICQKAAAKAGVAGGTLNPYKSIIIRAIEVLYAFDEAIRIITGMIMPTEPFVPVTARPATGRAATEAPRGLLFHRYRIDDAGLIAEARIIPPTSQNQLSIEEDLRQVVPARVGDTEDNLRAFCEQTIRNYDPCISCATHFLKIKRIPQKQWLEGELLK
jgi:coenzyme F420-reducing hydrogenase alpha subunit